MAGLYCNKKKSLLRYKYELELCYRKHWDYFHNKHTLPNVQSYVN
jgi:hypothetical protein